MPQLHPPNRRGPTPVQVCAQAPGSSARASNTRAAATGRHARMAGHGELLQQGLSACGRRRPGQPLSTSATSRRCRGRRQHEHSRAPVRAPLGAPVPASAATAAPHSAAPIRQADCSFRSLGEEAARLRLRLTNFCASHPPAHCCTFRALILQLLHSCLAFLRRTWGRYVPAALILVPARACFRSGWEAWPRRALASHRQGLGCRQIEMSEVTCPVPSTALPVATRAHANILALGSGSHNDISRNSIGEQLTVGMLSSKLPLRLLLRHRRRRLRLRLRHAVLLAKGAPLW